MDPKGLRVTQNLYFSLLTHYKQLLSMKICRCKGFKVLAFKIGGFKNKTKDWALFQNAALVMKIMVLKLGLVR